VKHVDIDEMRGKFVHKLQTFTLLVMLAVELGCEVQGSRLYCRWQGLKKRHLHTETCSGNLAVARLLCQKYGVKINVKALRGVYSCLWKTCRSATECHLPYGIRDYNHIVLPATQSWTHDLVIISPAS